MTEPLDTRGIEPHGSGFRAKLQHRGRRVTTKVVPTVEDAIADRDALREMLRKRRPPIAGGSVRDMGNAWLPTRKHLRAYANDRSRWENHVLPHAIAGLSVTEVRRSDVKQWLRDIEQDQPAWKSRDNCLTLLRSFFADAMDDELISRNPCDGVKVPGERPGENVDEYATPDEQQAMLFAMPVPDRFLAAFEMGSGLRRGESFSLHIADVHPDAAEPHILVRYGSRKKGKWLTPKNKRVRFVKLFGLALNAVRAQLWWLKAHAAPNPDGLLFPTSTGAKRDKPPESWEDARAVVTRTHFVWHSLRHICASTMLFGWWDGVPKRLEDVSIHLGHSGLAITQRYALMAYVSHQWTQDPYIPSLFKENEPMPPGVQVPKVAPTSLGDQADSARPRDTNHAAVTALEAYLAGDPRWERMALEILIGLVPDRRGEVLRAWRSA